MSDLRITGLNLNPEKTEWPNVRVGERGVTSIVANEHGYELRYTPNYREHVGAGSVKSVLWGDADD